MHKWEIRPPTEEEIKTYHQEFPIAVFYDGKLASFFKDQPAAEDTVKEMKDDQSVDEKLETFVRDLASDLDLSEAEVWERVQRFSVGPPRED